jgi:8-oxo-dGTP diphosphatase
MSREDHKYARVDVDPVILTPEGKIVLAKRKIDVFEGGRWHLPGGRLLAGERIEETLKGLAKKKTGFNIAFLTGAPSKNLIGVYDDPARDEREHVIGIAYLCRIIGGKSQPGYNVSEVKSFQREEIRNLDIAFDHKQMIIDGLGMLEWHSD